MHGIGPFEMVVAIVLIGVGGGVAREFARAIFGRGTDLGKREVREILQELRALRTDVTALQEGRSSRNETGVAAAGNTGARLAQLEQEMATLRDTTTQFDMSFDAALDRIERRVERVERVETNEPRSAASAVGEAPQILTRS